MKKLFYLVALVATVTFSACGGSSKMSDEDRATVEAFASYLDSRAKSDPQYGNTFVIQSVFLEDDNLVLQGLIDDTDITNGMTAKQAFKMLEAMGPQLTKSLANEIFNDPRARVIASIMRKWKCNMIFRLIGRTSGEQANIVLSYEDMPE